MKGAIARAVELAEQTPGAWIPQQFENPANPAVHARTTAQEIAADFPDGLDALITGVGTGGHITGCAQVLKQRWPGLQVFAVEPTLSPVISGGGAVPPPDPGDRRRVHPGQPAHAAVGRDDPGRCGGGARIRPPVGPGGGVVGRHLLRRHAGGDRAETAGVEAGQRGARLSTTTPGSAICRCPTSCRPSGRQPPSRCKNRVADQLRAVP